MELRKKEFKLSYKATHYDKNRVKLEPKEENHDHYRMIGDMLTKIDINHKCSVAKIDCFSKGLETKVIHIGKTTDILLVSSQEKEEIIFSFSNNSIFLSITTHCGLNFSVNGGKEKFISNGETFVIMKNELNEPLRTLKIPKLQIECEFLL